VGKPRESGNERFIVQQVALPADPPYVAALGMAELRLEIWSDIACPWCYIGKRRLEAALVQFPQRDAVRITWRSFELNPSAPLESDGQGYAERLANKYGTSLREAEAMIERVSDAAKAEGLEFDFRIIRPTSTFDAHRLLHLAKVLGLQNQLKERLFHAYFCEGKVISEVATLVQLGSEVGIDAQAASEVLRTDGHAKDVRADELDARELGIHAVPCFVFGARFGLSGAQPPDVLLRALDQAWQDAVITRSELAAGAACGPDGC
jgi:predicted DsbA family dithiol-disulfide isomerase